MRRRDKAPLSCRDREGVLLVLVVPPVTPVGLEKSVLPLRPTHIAIRPRCWLLWGVCSWKHRQHRRPMTFWMLLQLLWRLLQWLLWRLLLCEGLQWRF